MKFMVMVHIDEANLPALSAEERARVPREHGVDSQRRGNRRVAQPRVSRTWLTAPSAPSAYTAVVA
jgi:hypothetical protein